MFQNDFRSKTTTQNTFLTKSQTLPDSNNNSSSKNDFIEPPLLLQAINYIGLKDFLIDRFIFSRKRPQYRISKRQSQCQFHFTKTQLKQIPKYSQSFHLIDLKDHFIPVVHFKYDKEPFVPSDLNGQEQNKIQDKTKLCPDRITIIYSHGNSSNIEDSYHFVSSIAQIYLCDFIIYDYTGYTSEVGPAANFKHDDHKLSQQSISEDLKRVIEWSQIPHQQIIIWGFSLGCYPTISVASQLTKINGVILQSPFASIYRLMSGEVSYEKTFKNDIFSNIELIEKVQSNVLIVHSHDDQIIPYWHAESLLKICELMGKAKYQKLLELRKFGHNNLNQAFSAKKQNKLQEHIHLFVNRCTKDCQKQRQKQKNQQKKLHENSKKLQQNQNLAVHRLQFETKSSKVIESSLLRSSGQKSKRKLSLSSVFLQSSRTNLSQSKLITPAKGDSQQTIDSTKEI